MPRLDMARLEARLFFHTPCFDYAEVLQALRLVKLLPDFQAVAQAITNQSALFPHKTDILAVLKAEYDEEKNGQEKNNKKAFEENPFARARRLQKEGDSKESFRKKVGEKDWKKTKRIIEAFNGRVVAIS